MKGSKAVVLVMLVVALVVGWTGWAMGKAGFATTASSGPSCSLVNPTPTMNPSTGVFQVKENCKAPVSVVTQTVPGPTVTTTATATPSSPTTAPTTSPTTAPTTSSTTSAPASSGVCTTPYKTMTGNGSGPVADNPQYDASLEKFGTITQTMGICSHSSWYLDASTTDNQGSVESYPSMRRIYHDWTPGVPNDGSQDPKLSSFPYIKTRFASVDPSCPSTCIYDTAYDIWLNGIGNQGGSTELMIWTHNVNQYPAGYFDTGAGGSTKVYNVTLAGHAWKLYDDTADNIESFVLQDTPYWQSGSFDVKDFTTYLMSINRLAQSSSIGQISFGVEVIGTQGVKQHWDFTDFNVDDGGTTTQ